MLLYHDLSDRMDLLPPDLFTQDIHCLYSPDLAYIVGDGYPDQDGFRQIFLYHTENMKHEQLLRAWSDPIASRDHRCDLHNRWRPDGKKLSFDSTHEGFRGVYLADLALSLDRLR